MSKTQGKHKMNLAESTAGCGGPRKTTGISGHIKRGGEGCRQNETKKNERKPKSRLLMTKTLVEVRRPAQCAYACTNKESIYMYIYAFYIVLIYIHLHTSLYMYAYYTVSCRFCCPKTHELRSGGVLLPLPHACAWC